MTELALQPRRRDRHLDSEVQAQSTSCDDEGKGWLAGPQAALDESNGLASQLVDPTVPVECVIEVIFPMYLQLLAKMVLSRDGVCGSQIETLDKTYAQATRKKKSIMPVRCFRYRFWDVNLKNLTLALFLNCFGSLSCGFIKANSY